MTYRVNRAVGHQRWGVTNPWVWANYGQPQRKRGYVSPMVFQTASPYLKSAHLGTAEVPDDLAVAQAELRRANEELMRGERMEKIAMTGLIMSGVSLLLAYQFYSERKKMAANGRRRRRRRRTSRRR
jgi:uncharacterized metal-binding protein